MDLFISEMAFSVVVVEEEEVAAVGEDNVVVFVVVAGPQPMLDDILDGNIGRFGRDTTFPSLLSDPSHFFSSSCVAFVPVWPLSS